MSKSLWKLVKFFLVSILTIVGFASPLVGAVDVNNALQCAPRVQTTTATTVWKCPALPNLTSEPIKITLGNVDFSNGTYSCVYNYERSGEEAQSCNYTSSFYQKEEKKARKTIDDKVSIFTPFVFQTDFNFVNATGMETMSLLMQEGTNKLLVKLKGFRDSANNPNNSLSKTEADLFALRGLIATSLIDPYTGASPDKKDNNFALFLAGLVTLDSDIISGYEEHSGKLLISSDWRTKATSVNTDTSLLTEAAIAAVGAGNAALRVISTPYTLITGNPAPQMSAPNARTDLRGMPDGVKMTSWVEIFEMKLWGFYYNLNRRFDIAFDAIATKLLFMMFTWFVLFSGVKRGVGYLLNSDNSFRMTEEKWIKTLVILLSVVTFYISVPQPISSTLDGKSATSAELGQEFYKNKTIAKGIIRMTASMGQHLGTMMSDLGLSAYLDYMIKKQNVYAGSEVSEMMVNGLHPLIMYYPAYQIINQCRGYYDASDKDFLNAPRIMLDEGFKTNNNYTSPFFTGNNISGVNLALCHKAYLIVSISPSETAQIMAEVDISIKDKNAIKAKSMKFIVTNMILMQQKMGWINTFSVPISYFLFKNSDMFLSKGADSDAIAKIAKKYMENNSIKSKEIKVTDLGEDDTRSAAGVVLTGAADSVAAFFADMGAGIMSYGAYNMLPAFPEIQQSIKKTLRNMYDSKLSIYLKKKSENSMAKVKSFALSIMKKIPLTSFLSKVMELLDETVEASTIWNAIITMISYVVAIYIWKLALVTALTALIGTMSLLKIVLYFKNLLVHTMTSLVYFLWAFASGNAHNKLNGFMKDTMILMFYPILIVLSLYIFIFEFELLNILYTFIMAGMIEGQRTNISLMDMANNGDGSTMSAYFNMTMLINFSEVVVQMFGIVLAYLTIMKLPETILKKIGISEGEHSVGIGSDHESMNAKGIDRVSNPMK